MSTSYVQTIVVVKSKAPIELLYHVDAPDKGDELGDITDDEVMTRARSVGDSSNCRR